MYFDKEERLRIFKEFYRTLKKNGKLIITDSCIMKGLISTSKLSQRSFQSEVFFHPPGTMEKLIKEADLTLIMVEDITANNAALISRKWHSARSKRKTDLYIHEGEKTFTINDQFVNVCCDLYDNTQDLGQYSYFAIK
jgi:hypothetical protein